MPGMKYLAMHSVVFGAVRGFRFLFLMLVVIAMGVASHTPMFMAAVRTAPKSVRR
jgi:hypothetical protein